jgi:hypothetical protein
MLDRSLRNVVLLCKVLVEAGQTLVLWFRSTMLNAAVKPFKVLHRAVWQSWIGGSVPYRGYENYGGRGVECSREAVMVARDGRRRRIYKVCSVGQQTGRRESDYHGEDEVGPVYGGEDIIESKRGSSEGGGDGLEFLVRENFQPAKPQPLEDEPPTRETTSVMHHAPMWMYDAQASGWPATSD